jgi:cell division protein FtsB
MKTLVANIKEQHQRIKELEKENEELKKQIDDAIDGVIDDSGISEGWIPTTEEEKKLLRLTTDFALCFEELEKRLNKSEKDLEYYIFRDLTNEGAIESYKKHIEELKKHIYLLKNEKTT